MRSGEQWHRAAGQLWGGWAVASCSWSVVGRLSSGIVQLVSCGEAEQQHRAAGQLWGGWIPAWLADTTKNSQATSMTWWRIGSSGVDRLRLLQAAVLSGVCKVTSCLCERFLENTDLRLYCLLQEVLLGKTSQNVIDSDIHSDALTRDVNLPTLDV